MGWIVARKKQEPEISPENQATIEKMADLLGQANDLRDQIDWMGNEDLYVYLLNLIHNRIPDTTLLGILVTDANDSDMLCPK